MRRAAYIDAFGDTEDGQLMREAHDMILADELYVNALVAALRQLTGEQFENVHAVISRAITDSIAQSVGSRP
jgi:hypothetical protein